MNVKTWNGTVQHSGCEPFRLEMSVNVSDHLAVAPIPSFAEYHYGPCVVLGCDNFAWGPYCEDCREEMAGTPVNVDWWAKVAFGALISFLLWVIVRGL